MPLEPSLAIHEKIQLLVEQVALDRHVQLIKGVLEYVVGVPAVLATSKAHAGARCQMDGGEARVDDLRQKAKGTTYNE